MDEIINFYAFTKHQFSKTGKFLAQQDQVVFTNFLLEQFIGPKDNGNKFIPFLINKMLKNEPIDLTDGLQRRDIIYIDDVISAYEIMVEQDGLSGYSEFSLGTGEAPKIREVVVYLKKLLKSTSKLNFGALEKRANEPEILISDNSKLKENGWECQTTWKKGLERIVAKIKTTEI